MLQYVNINPFDNGAHSAEDCASAASLGCDGVRISEEQGWSNWESSLDVFNASAKNAGIHIFQTCQPKNHVMPTTDNDIAAYANYVATCASKSQVKFVGVGNETNGFGINSNWDPVLAGKITLACLKACANLPPAVMQGKYVVTHEVCPGSGLQNSQGVWPAYSEPLRWFSEMIAKNPAILSSPHLAIGWHPYDDPNYSADVPLDWNTCYKAFEADRILYYLTGRHIPFAFGEYGFPIRRNGLVKQQAVDTETQQTYGFNDYQRAFRAFRKAGMNIRVATWFNLKDTTMANTSDWPACCGWLKQDGTERAVCAAVRSLNGV